jgi:hypothetical protein
VRAIGSDLVADALGGCLVLAFLIGENPRNSAAFYRGVSNGDRTRDNWNHKTLLPIEGAREASKQGDRESARDASRPLEQPSDRSRTDHEEHLAARLPGGDSAPRVPRLAPVDVREVGRLAGELAALAGAADTAGALDVYQRLGALLFGERAGAE